MFTTFKTNEEFNQFFYNLTPEFLEIYSLGFDNTGRPVCDFPHSTITNALLDKTLNEHSGIHGFINNMKTIFPSMTNYEISTTYEIYIHGMKTVQNYLSNDNKEIKLKK